MELPKVIMFDGDSVPSLVRFFLKQIADGLEELGYEIYKLELSFENNHNEGIYDYIKKNKCIVFTSNGIGVFQNRHLIFNGDSTKNKNPFWDQYDIPVYDYLLDHCLWLPYSLYSKTIPKNYIMPCVDMNHDKYLKRHKKKSFFLPLGGSVDTIDIPFDKKKDQIIFCANLKTQPTTRILQHNSEDVETIIEECTKNTDYTIEDAAKKHNITKLRNTYLYAENNLRRVFRKKIVETVASSGLPLVIYGTGWKYLKERNLPNVSINEFQFADECLRYTNESKFSLNVLPWFKKGGHDRLFDGYANGTMCITDSNQYLDTVFTDNISFKKYDLDKIEDIPRIFDYYLNHIDESSSIAEEGKKIVLENHTWKERAKLLDKIWKERNFDYE